MPAGDFHEKAFDEGTLTKLQIFELYTREWLPVFLASPQPPRSEIHVFDFFAGPGMDTNGVLGSPLRVIRQMEKFQSFPGWPKVRVHAHFSDVDPVKISTLEENIRQGLCPRRLHLDVQTLSFEDALATHRAILRNANAAKLLFIDQFGVDKVPDEVFRELVRFPTCDFLFFVSSSTLHRFRDHPAIKLKITRPDDYYHVHRAALDYYRDLLPRRAEFYLAPFSIKKGTNIYGIIFGTAHPLGMDKFLQVAWKKDEINGEADYDINRENFRPGQLQLFRPTKLTAFERELEDQLRSGRLKDEAAVVRLCFEHGVKRQHARVVLAKLKAERVIAAEFHVPQTGRLASPRPVRVL